MERKNTVLLTVIAVATLLVAVVGATFAYFTAASSVNGDLSTNNSEGTTKTVSGTKLKLAAGTNVAKFEYPGGVGVASANAQAVKTVDGDANNYKLSFDVNFTVTNGTTSAVNYKLYRSTTAIDVTKLNCTLGGQATNELAYSCNQDTLFTGTAVKSGSVAAGQTLSSELGKYADALNTTGTTADTGDTAYYYLVVEYPNDPTKSQNADFGKKISASISGTSTPVAAMITSAS